MIAPYTGLTKLMMKTKGLGLGLILGGAKALFSAQGNVGVGWVMLGLEAVLFEAALFF